MARTPLLRAVERLAKSTAQRRRSASETAERTREASSSSAPASAAPLSRSLRPCFAQRAAGGHRAPDRDRRRRNRRPDGSPDARGQGRTAQRSTKPRPTGSAAACTPTRSGYWAHGQVSEFCGELIDTGHKTIRHLAGRFNLPLDDLLAAQPSGTDDTYWFFGGYYPRAQADRGLPADPPDAESPSQGDRLSDDCTTARPRRVSSSTTCRSTTGSRRTSPAVMARAWARCSTPRITRSTARRPEIRRRST